MKVSIVGGGPGGMYFAILAKKQWPQWQITIYEQNKANDTFGFGVVFSDETLGFLHEYDEPSYQAIRRSFAYWDDIDIHFKTDTVRISGNGFCGCSRLTLLQLLQARCEALGVQIHFQTIVDDLELFSDSDLIVAADGANSVVREKYKDHFGTQITWRDNYFCWLGSQREMDAFKYCVRRSEHGVFVAHCYQYEPGMSTWIPETTAKTWQAHGFDKMTEPEYIPILEEIFAEDLQGHSFIDNRSLWRNFPTVRNSTWVKDNIVLLGDAQHTAHFSIGSGTKLAMESSIALFESFREKGAVAPALAHFDVVRREDVERTQYAADVSSAWFESLEDHWDLEPEQFAFQLMSRSKQITYENLRLRDSNFVQRCDEWYVGQQRRGGYTLSDSTPAMFVPFRMRELELTNRIVMSPMAQYSAVDGMPNEWHHVHYCSRALGGAGLVYTEMVCPSAEGRITPGCAGIWSEAQRDAWQRSVEFIHTHSQAKVCLQIGHAGRKASTRVAWEGMDLPLTENNWPIYSASALKYREKSAVPIEIDPLKMDEISAQLVESARFAESAGFDMLELHMAHGYLLGSFISPLTNQRQDKFGGTIDRRMRYPLEVFRAVRDVWPEGKPMSVRISASDWYTGGLSEQDMLEACRMLQAAGVDLINVSTGQTVSLEQPVYGRMFQVPFADKIRQRVGIPTLVAGNISSADQVNTIVISGRADLVSLARPHLTDPYFTLHAAAAYNYQDQLWNEPYASAKFQAYLLAEREEEQNMAMRRAMKPPSHEVKE